MPTPRCLQVRGRLNGGSKSKHADADVQKLIQHLIQKGVSEDEAAGRADQVLQHITPDQLQQAYRSLEPWAAVKAAVGQKVRLVTPLRHAISNKRASQAELKPVALTLSPPAPLLKTRGASRTPQSINRVGTANTSMSLIVEHFACQDGSTPQLLSELSSQVRGASRSSPSSKWKRALQLLLGPVSPTLVCSKRKGYSS